jgi:hypothetical protein
MPVELSVVVVAYDMERELPRTLYSLSSRHQIGIDPDDYEVIVVDNGSPEAIRAETFEHLGDNFRFERLEPAPPSPASAANLGLERARGASVGLVVDGARMASPGLLATARLGLELAELPVVASLGWHLGPVRHMDAAGVGYDQRAEDELLDSVDWMSNGYALFEVSTLAASSARGWFGPMAESSALFMPSTLWTSIGGLDPAFALPGGGLVNHDLYRRAQEEPGTTLVVLLGEGTFHQIHGGAATSQRFEWDAMHDDYRRIRGVPYEQLERDALYVGAMPREARRHLESSIEERVGRPDEPKPRRRLLRRGT